MNTTTLIICDTQIIVVGVSFLLLIVSQLRQSCGACRYKRTVYTNDSSN